MYDVVIIGAGISGLVCGCYLAKAGMKVLIVEQHNKPGGYFTSFKRNGFLFDAAAHSFGNYRESGHVRKIFTDLGVDKITKIKRFDPSDVIVAPDFKITFWNDKNNTIAELTNIFPNEERNIINFFNFLIASEQSEFAKLKDKTFSELLHSFFKDERLISAFAFPVFGNGGLPPHLMHSFSGAKILSEFIIDGGYYTEGGIQNLPNALANILIQNNGKVLYGKLVRKIICENNMAVGLVLDSGELFYSRYVVSACDMTQTFKNFLDEKAIDKQIADNLNKMSPSMSTFILYLGLDKFFKNLPEPGTNTWYLPHYDLDKIYHEIQECDFNMSGHMLRVAPDKKTIVAFVGAPFRTEEFWKQNKQGVAQDFLGRIKKFIPDIDEHIVYFDTATPSTLCRYTRNYKGAAFGWAKTPAQTYDAIYSRTTSIRGLFLTGHWTSIAFGMPGACYSGHDTARRILRKEKINLHTHGKGNKI